MGMESELEPKTREHPRILEKKEEAFIQAVQEAKYIPRIHSADHCPQFIASLKVGQSHSWILGLYILEIHDFWELGQLKYSIVLQNDVGTVQRTAISKLAENVDEAFSLDGIATQEECEYLIKFARDSKLER